MSKSFVAPENLAELDAADLEAAVNAAFDRYNEIKPKDGEPVDDAIVEELRTIKDFVASAKAENTARVEAEEARKAELADIEREMSEGLTPAEEAEEVVPGENDQPAEEIPAGDPAEEEKPEEAAAQPAGELVTASRKAPANFSRRSFAAQAAQAAPKTEVPAAKAERARLINPAGIKSFAPGQEFATLSEGAGVLAERARQLPSHYIENKTIGGGGLVIQLPSTEFSDNNPKYQGKEGALQMMLDAGDETRLPGKSLVAAGGWGGVSERSLDFCEIESIEGLFNMPETTITRGGTEWTKGPVFADILGSNTGFWDMTEAEAEAGTELKTSLRPSLPTFQERRLDAVGIMLEAGLLLRQGWPEVIARHADLLIKAHAYKLAQKKLGLVRGFTGAAVDLAGAGFGNAMDLFHILELIATGERQRTFMSPNQTLEVVLPHWVKNVVRVDVANRNGVADFKSITDAQIDAEFTARKLKAQWITGDQNLTIDPVKKVALAYPNTVDVLMYPAGTYVAGVAPVISLDTIYDSTNLKKNDYVHLFIEQGVLVTNPCGDGLNVRIPLLANGKRAIDDIAKNFGTAPTP